MVLKGLPEPLAKRTVEGDLGLRYNALPILDLAGEKRLAESAAIEAGEIGPMVERLGREVASLPRTDKESRLDLALASTATRVAMARHAGSVEALWGPQGQYYVQHGKDLSRVGFLIGTGGIFTGHPLRAKILRETLATPAEPFSLRPVDPVLLADERYCLFAVGLLAQSHPDQALRVAKRHLREVGAA